MHRMRLMPASETSCVVFPSELGWFAMSLGKRGVRYLTFTHESPADAVAALNARACDANESQTLLDAEDVPLAQRLQRYAAGERDDFLDVKIDAMEDGEFVRRVIAHCRRVGHGSTSSYKQLAEKAGAPRSARAVGNVMARNRVPIIVPCHRVLASGGGLGGYSMNPGLPLKRLLLRLEGIQHPMPQAARRARRTMIVT